MVDDGPGWNLVFMMRLTEGGRTLLTEQKTASSKLIKRFLTCDDGDPIRDRLKAIARFVNLNEVPLNMLVKVSNPPHHSVTCCQRFNVDHGMGCVV